MEDQAQEWPRASDPPERNYRPPFELLHIARLISLHVEAVDARARLEHYTTTPPAGRAHEASGGGVFSR
jgi:hypothetical protein